MVPSILPTPWHDDDTVPASSVNVQLPPATVTAQTPPRSANIESSCWVRTADALRSSGFGIHDGSKPMLAHVPFALVASSSVVHPCPALSGLSKILQVPDRSIGKAPRS